MKPSRKSEKSIYSKLGHSKKPGREKVSSLAMGISIITAWKVSVFGVFLVRIFSHSDWARSDTKYLSISSLNARKYGPENLRLRTPPNYSFMTGNCFKLIICIQFMSDTSHLSQQNIFSGHRQSLSDVLSIFLFHSSYFSIITLVAWKFI